MAAAGQDLPRLSDSKNAIWKTEIPGRGHGSPIVVGDRVILPPQTNKRRPVFFAWTVPRASLGLHKSMRVGS